MKRNHAVLKILKEYMDSTARVNPAELQHVYEWYRVGSPDARLFDISYRPTPKGLVIMSQFSQSSSLQKGAKTPFSNKAAVMESGGTVIIRPRASKVLVFEQNGEDVFTKGPVIVKDPGGGRAAGGFEKNFNEFFNNYFSQSFLQISGFAQHLENATPFARNFASAKRGGKSLGISVGHRWVANKEGGVL